jgi:hypothetical protein
MHQDKKRLQVVDMNAINSMYIKNTDLDAENNARARKLSGIFPVAELGIMQVQSNQTSTAR